MARLTLNGMYEYDPSIFDGMILPDDYDREAMFAEIMTRCGQLYPYHQVPAVLKSNIRLWFARNFLNFDRSMEALIAEYNPIENYDKHEYWKRTPDLTDESDHTGKDTLQLSGKDALQLSGSDTKAHTGTDTIEASGTDATEASGKDTIQLSGTDTTALSGKDTIQLSGKDTDQLSGTDTTTRTYTSYNETSTRTGTDTTERSVSAFDSSVYSPAEKTVETFGSISDSKNITGSYADATAYGKKDETTYGRKDETTYGKSEDLTYGKKDETTYGRKDETTYGRSDETTYNSEEETTYGRKDETTYGRKDEQSYDSTVTDRHTGTEEYENYTHGNIGVTTNQQMITAELELRKFDIYSDIAARFEHEFIVQVY